MLAEFYIPESLSEMELTSIRGMIEDLEDRVALNKNK